MGFIVENIQSYLGVMLTGLQAVKATFDLVVLMLLFVTKIRENAVLMQL